MTAQNIADSIAQCHNRLTPIPFDRNICPRDNSFWEHLTDDEIMKVPPHVAVHAMRTSAQNGAQVISPRQIPSSYMLGRTNIDASQPFLHVAASEANANYVWPVPDKHPPLSSKMTEGRVVIKRGAPLSRRSPAKSSPITYATSKVSNPFHKAALKIKANVDFQNREDIRGDPDELAVAYARLWGQEDNFFTCLSTVTLAHLTDLQSHAITSDTAFARYLGPIQDRRVLTVAATASSTTAFGQDFAVDWNCMRVSAEAKYALSVTAEGYSLKELAIPNPIGSYSPDSRPPCAIVYHPNPGIAWCHGSLSFQVRCDTNTRRMKVPRVISTEMISNRGTVRVSDVLRLYDAAVRWTTTQTTGANFSANALAGSVTMISSATSRTLSTGRTSHKAVRQALMEALKSAPIDARRMLARSVAELVPVLDAISVSSTDQHVRFHCCEYLAKRFQTLDGSINAKIIQAAATRNEDPEYWFASLLRQMPRKFADLKTGGFGWTIMAMLMLTKPPNAKWMGYYKSLAAVGIEAMADIVTPMPSIPPTEEPELWDVIALRCSAVAHAKKDMYSSSYMGVANACFVMSSAYRTAGYDDLATLFRASGCLWAFRSRCAETVGVVIAAPGTIVPTHGHSVDCVLPHPLNSRRVIATTAPYVYYRALIKGMHNLGLLTEVDVPEAIIGRISDHVNAWPPILDVDDALTWENANVRGAIRGGHMIRYVLNPRRLATDMENFMEYAIEDAISAVKGAVTNLENNAAQRRNDAAARDLARREDANASAAAAAEILGLLPAATEAVVSNSSGWDLIFSIEETTATEIIEAYETGDIDAQEILESTYPGETEFLMRVARRYAIQRNQSSTANVLR